MAVTIDDILAAQDRIASGIYVSPCPESRQLSPLCNATVYCKLEYLQRTGSFKERGARNALLLLDARAARARRNYSFGRKPCLGTRLSRPAAVDRRDRGHAQACAVDQGGHVPRLWRKGDPARRNVRRGMAHAESLSESVRLAVHPRLQRRGDHRRPGDARAGNPGASARSRRASSCPVGGGGLIAGVSLAVKSRRPEVMIVGVEALHTPNFTPSLAAGQPVAYAPRPTLADGLAVGKAGEIPFEIARTRIDRLVQVSEDELCTAVLRLVELEKSVVEGAAPRRWRRA